MGYEAQDRLGLLDGDALRRNLTALARSESDPARLRPAALTLIKQEFHGARARVKARVENGTLTGVVAARALSGVQDILIQVLYDFAVKHFYYAQNPTESERIAVVATGGYGRGQLAPGSDIDLLFIRPFKQTAWGESVIEFILHMLWDLGLKVGHATRSLAECTRLAKDDITIATSLLEARYLCGDRTLFDALRTAFRTEVAAGTGPHYVAAKLAERDERHRRQGESRYLVEPNVKDGKGGLRDLQTLYWIGKYLYQVDDAADLVNHNVFSRDEYKLFQKAESFLWDVRCQLHYATGRAEERLTFDVQPEIARRMGFAADSPRRAVEQFMHAYFLAAKDVGDLTRIFCAALEEQNRKERPKLSRLLPGFLKPRAGQDELFVEHGRLNARADAFQRNPLNLIRIFHLAETKGVDVHPAALRTITRSLDLITDALRADPRANSLFLEILTARRDPERALRRMNEAGVLARFIPDFEHAVGLMQFNMYHHYTVDEHLIRAVGNVAALERGDLKAEHPLATELIRRNRAREVLYCATFLHDIAKGLGGNHSLVGATIAERLCPRLGLPPEETAAVAWLVKNHLVMSDTAQRRDISDPKTVGDFVAAVQSPEMLRLLLILTVVDIRAVGPGVWNEWKGQLLRELYYAAEATMAGGDTSPGRSHRIAQAKEALSRRLTDLPEAKRRKILERHYDPYWLAFDTASQERHARLMLQADSAQPPDAPAAWVRAGNGATEIIVYAPDRPGLFSRIAGAIAAAGASIVEAKAFTTTDGCALDFFSVHDGEGGGFSDSERLERIQASILRRLNEDGPIRLSWTIKKRNSAFDVRPRIAFDNDASAVSTLIEVDAADRPGLLHDVSRAIYESRLSISSAIVATYGERAVDVFYVRDVFGHKIFHPDRQEEVRRRILAAITQEMA